MKKCLFPAVLSLVAIVCYSLQIEAQPKKCEKMSKAVIDGDLQAVRKMIQQGCDVNMRDEFGRSPIFTASQFGHVSIVELLIEKGANTFARDDDGWTVLHVAASSGYKDVTETLIKHGSSKRTDFNVNERIQGFTPLKLSIEEEKRLTKTNRLKPGMDFQGVQELLRKHGGTL